MTAHVTYHTVDIRQGEHLEHARLLPRSGGGRMLVEEVSSFIDLLLVKAGAEFEMNSCLLPKVVYPFWRMLAYIEVL